jgi:DNA-binding NtrC family response regulator
MTHILVIDDDRNMRTACSRVLSKAGWTVICAETGEEGLKELRSGAQKIDVVLVDRLMPGLSGEDVLARIHTLDPNLPVIIMTGSATDESTIELKRQGAFDCLGKPFTPAELRNVITRAAGKPSDSR